MYSLQLYEHEFYVTVSQLRMHVSDMLYETQQLHKT